MGVRKKWAGYSALMVLPWLGIQQALPATAEYPSFPEQPSVEMHWPMALEAQPTEEDGETGIAQLTETDRAGLEDLKLSIDFNQGNFVRDAAILPENSEAQSPLPMDLEAQPTQEEGEIAIEQLTEADHAGFEDLELSIDFNKGDFVRGAAILPENEAQSPNASDLAQARFPNYRYSAGFDLPTFGWVRMDGRGVDSVLGINLGLGVSYKKYFQPAVPGQFTGSWGVGTFALVLPYATIGGDYQWDNGWYAGGNIGAGLYYFDDVTPFPVGYIGVGYRW
ncbi:hypothetical protein [Oscillatoria acuminata]|uniref:Uncharacterized protein n=1 Tax=Oscillatoria acuminata PCC 6304 TaxID=56110 RepID=K9TJJ4_9CYAN|nr:hypothetical protein [Oscillatoria acuminata]AFY82573.1 hypothetical protein Oscil6304_2975 [Oscillatoria acuminata PCC 6304]